MIRFLVTASAAALALASAPAAAETLLLGDPALSANDLAFTYAGDIWIANRDGSNPRRLTSSPADEMRPRFSPDGSTIAFSANLDGNYDVFVVPVAGGQPRRLTWHPGSDRVVGWSADGRSVAFVSARERRAGRAGQLYHASLDGGLPVKVSEARVQDGAWSADGKLFAGVPFASGYNGLDGGSSGWRGYRGGSTPPIQIIDFSGKTVETVGDDRTTNRNPVWLGGQLYYLSHREGGTYNVYRYDPATRAITRLTDETEWDVRSMGGDGGRIVYEAAGRLKALDLSAGAAATPLAITLNADLPERQARWKEVSKNTEEAHISPSGARVAVTARGEVFTVPTDQGAVRNISNSAGQRNYSGIWSPRGTELAYVEDDGARQQVVIEDQSGTGTKRRLPIDGAFSRLHGWGGKGSGTIAYSNNKLELRTLDVASGNSRLVATAKRRQMGYGQQFEATVSPDGQWLAFTNEGRNFNAGLYLYQFATGTTYPVSGEFADVGSPTFSRDGKLLFFTASTNSGPAQVGLDMTTQEQPFRSGIYAAVLERGAKSPIAPVLADEAAKPEPEVEPKKDAKKPAAAKLVAVDPADLIHRVVALPVGEAFYSALATDKDGALYYVRSVQSGGSSEEDPATLQADAELLRFDFKERESETLARGVVGIEMNAAGDKLLIVKPGNKIAVAEVGKKLEVKPVDLSGMRMNVDPRTEWAQIFNDAWRMEGAYFYDPAMHGIDWNAVRAKYAPLVQHVGRREDLNTLIVQMIAELGVGHNRAGGGDVYSAGTPAKPGLLGADFTLANGRYRISRIYDGGYWNPEIKAPLAAPGVAAREGEYVIAVGGRELTARDNIYERLSGAAGGQVQLTLAGDPGGAGKREVVVEPVADESQLRLWGWIEDNRRKVDQATGGKAAYVYMPNTAGDGFRLFNRMFFAQADRQALILDDRANGGGQAANYVIEVLGRKRLAGWKDREGLVFDTPGGAIYGPKVMLIDQDAGSGGDFMPWAFSYAGIGKLIGTRTWGGLIGISANPDLVDGGSVVVPFFRAFDPEGRWLIENVGTVPDMRVELDQMALEQGRDTQLDAAIAQVMADLAASPPIDRQAAPAFPQRRGD